MAYCSVPPPLPPVPSHRRLPKIKVEVGKPQAAARTQSMKETSGNYQQHRHSNQPLSSLGQYKVTSRIATGIN